MFFFQDKNIFYCLRFMTYKGWSITQFHPRCWTIPLFEHFTFFVCGVCCKCKKTFLASQICRPFSLFSVFDSCGVQMNHMEITWLALIAKSIMWLQKGNEDYLHTTITNPLLKAPTNSNLWNLPRPKVAWKWFFKTFLLVPREYPSSFIMPGQNQLEIYTGMSL